MIKCFYCHQRIWWGDKTKQWLMSSPFPHKPAHYCGRNLGKWYHEPAIEESK